MFLHRFITFPLVLNLFYLFFYIAGIISYLLTYSFLSLTSFFALILILLLANLLLYFFRRKMIFRTYIFSSIYMFGILRTYWVHQEFLFLNQATQKPFFIEALVIDVEKKNRNNYEIILEIISCSIPNTERYLVKIFTHKQTSTKVGDIIYSDNLVASAHDNEKYNFYRIKERILAIIFTNNFVYKKSVAKNINTNLRQKIALYRYSTNNNLKSKLSELTYSLYGSLFLGKKMTSRKNYTHIKDQFSFWGISHYLARSGLHVMLIAFLWGIIIGLLPCGINVKQFLLILLILIYNALSWSSISFLRAFTTFILCKLALLKGLPIYSLHAIVVTCFLLLAHNPIYLIYVDFQLTFLLTFALAWMHIVKIMALRIVPQK